MSPPIVYERRFGRKRGWNEALMLDETHLRRQVSSGTKCTHAIPIDEIQAFYAENVRIEAAGPRSAIAAASQSIVRTTGQLLVNWAQDGKLRKASFHVDVGDPEFLSLYRALKARRPDACLEGLTDKEARKRLGRLSKEAQALIFIFVVIGGVLLWAGVKALLHDAGL